MKRSVILTAKEAAIKIGCSRSSIFYYIYSGKLNAEKHGRDWMIDEKDLGLFKEKQQNRSIKNGK